jgi:hypothetical protein
MRIDDIARILGGTSPAGRRSACDRSCGQDKQKTMHEIIYLIGLVVVVMFILGLIGVR